jgi:hypothetical protein
MLSSITSDLTGKSFTSQRLRISYITAWHKANAAKGIDLKKLRTLMRQMLQTNVGINLGYSKKETAELADMILADMTGETAED